MKTLMRTIAIAALVLFATANAKAYTLEQDEDWSNRVQQFPDTIDLNGHNLIVSRLETCTITDSSELGSGGELRINSATDVTKTDAMTITGSLTFVKDGAGTLSWNGGTIAETAPILVTNGVFRLGTGLPADVFGNAGTITVKGKGQFCLNNDTTDTVPNKTFLIEGEGPNGSGAIVNGSKRSNLKDVRLTGDATIGGNANIDFRGNYGVTGPDYVLTVKNTRYIAFCGGKAYLNVRRVICDGGGDLRHPDVVLESRRQPRDRLRLGRRHALLQTTPVRGSQPASRYLKCVM